LLVSMTGFGRGTSSGRGWKFSVEVRSVNHRFREISPKLPRELSSLEERLVELLKERICRGRVDVYVSAERTGEAPRRLKVDKGLAMAYYNSLRELQTELAIPGNWGVELVAAFPEIFSLSEDEGSEDAWPPLRDAVTEALDRLCEMRGREGRAMCEALRERVASVGGLVEEIERSAPEAIEEYRQRLEEQVSEYLSEGAIDEDRLAAEIVLYAERSDVHEEVVRLKSHLEQLEETLQQDGPVGRKLEFICQELNREMNTIGAKSTSSRIGRAVVEAKSDLEKIRELAQNVE